MFIQTLIIMIALFANSTETLPGVAVDFLERVKGKRKFAFYGEMGAGKTTIIIAICRVLGARDAATSPSFALINEYFTTSGDNIYHIDFYRIDSSDELYDIGIEEYLYDQSYCFIEWPDKAEEVLPDDIVKVYIEETGNGARKISILTDD